MTAGPSADPGSWVLPCPGRRPDAPLRLLGLCHAGGSAVAMRPLGQAAPGSYDICAIELPGHGTRLGEPLVADLPALAGMLVDGVGGLLDRPTVLYGQSMGGLLALEAAVRMADAGRPASALVVVGRGGPTEGCHETLHDLDDDALLEWWRRQGSTPEALTRDPEMVGLFLPVLRADLQAVETYRHSGRQVDCPVHVFGGHEDPSVTDGCLETWAAATTGPMVVHRLPGGHLPLAESGAIDMIADVLARLADDLLTRSQGVRAQPQRG